MHSSGKHSTLTPFSRAYSIAAMMLARFPSQSSGVWLRVAAATRSRFMCESELSSSESAKSRRGEFRRRAAGDAVGSARQIFAGPQATVAITQAQKAAAPPVVEALERGHDARIPTRGRAREPALHARAALLLRFTDL